MQGLKKLVGIFDGIDKIIIDCSNGCRESSNFDCGKLTQSKVLEFHRSQAKAPSPRTLKDSISSSAGGDSQRSEQLPSHPAMQEVDILVTQQWLFGRLWQLCLKHKLLDVHHKHKELRLDFIIKIARNVLQVCKQASLDSMEVHGVGFVRSPSR